MQLGNGVTHYLWPLSTFPFWAFHSSEVHTKFFGSLTLVALQP